MSHALVVCTANVCRSPIGAALLSGVLGPDVPVLSAGTQADPRLARCVEAGSWLAASEAGPGRVVTTPVTGSPTLLGADVIRGAGLILTAGRIHRSAVIRLLPRAQQVTFTLRQAARLAEWYESAEGDQVSERLPRGDGRGPLAFLVDSLDAVRGLAVRPESAEDDDILDPHEDEGATHEMALEQVAECVDVLGNLLRRISGDVRSAVS